MTIVLLKVPSNKANRLTFKIRDTYLDKCFKICFFISPAILHV